MTWENVIALLGACSVLIVALLKLKPNVNGSQAFVSKEVCSVITATFGKRLDEFFVMLKEIRADVKEIKGGTE